MGVKFNLTYSSVKVLSTYSGQVKGLPGQSMIRYSSSNPPSSSSSQSIFSRRYLTAPLFSPTSL